MNSLDLRPLWTTDSLTMRRPAPIIVVLIVIGIAALIAWGSSRPSWQISARNSAQGVIVEVYKSNAERPTYRTVLAGQTTDAEVDRATRIELPAELGQTTFYDDTLRPGRWRVMLQGTEIDIMEHLLIVDGASEIRPEDSSP